MQQIVCLSDELKAIMMGVLQETGIQDRKAENFIAGLPLCTSGAPLEVREIKVQGNTATKRKRKPSAYNMFISECMKKAKIKETGKRASSVMKECALEWKKNH